MTGGIARARQSGLNAPMLGTKSKKVAKVVNIPAISRFPPPAFLTETQKQLWIASLADIRIEFFRARHIPMMIQYVRAVDAMMTFGNRMTLEPDDPEMFSGWKTMMGIAKSLEKHLSLDTHTLIRRTVEARNWMRSLNDEEHNLEAHDTQAVDRKGLTYGSDS